MADKEKYYILIPSPGTQEDRYVPVDLDRLNLGTITTVYEIDPDRSGNRKFRPCHGIECRVKTSIDVDPICRIVDDITEQARSVVEQFGEHGETAMKHTFDHFRLKEIVRSVAEGKSANAEELVRQMLYEFMGSASVIAGVFAENVKLAARVEGLSATMTVTVGSGEAYTQEILSEWMGVTAELNTTRTRLEDVERRLRSEYDNVASFRTQCKIDLAPERNVLCDALRFFGDPETMGDMESFNDRAFMYRPEIDTDKREEMETLVRTANETIVRCEAIVRTLGEQRAGLETRINAMLYPPHPAPSLLFVIDDLCRVFAEKTRLVKDYRKRFPPELKLDQATSNAITEEEVAAAEATLQDPAWAPGRVKSRMDELRDSLLNEIRHDPAIPPKLASAIAKAKRYIDVFTREWNASVPPPPCPLPRNESAQPQGSDGVTGNEEDSDDENPPDSSPATSGDRTPVSIDPALSQSVYEQVIGVGYVLSCRPYNLADCTVRGILKVLAQLGRIPKDEIGVWGKHLQALMLQPSEAHRIQEDEKKSVLWKKTDKRWVTFFKKGRYYFKLSQRFAADSERLLAVHGLTEDQIHTAHKESRKYYLEEYRKLHRSA
jgi:hypothetical protein